MLSLGAFLAGALMLIVTVGVPTWAAARVTRGYSGATRATAWMLVATALIALTHGIPLALGVMNRVSVLVATAVLAVVARRVRVPPPVRAPRERVPMLAGGVVVVVAAASLAYVRLHAGEPSYAIDTLSFQLPQVARWIQTGSLWQLDQFFPDYSNATYPSTANLLFLAVTLPFKSFFLARDVGALYLLGGAVAVYALARELRASRGWAVLGAALLAAAPVATRTTLQGANTDTEMMAFTVAAVLFALRYHRTSGRGDLWLAAVATGLAFGTKWYALTIFPLLVLVWIVARYRGRVRPGRIAREIGVVILGCAVLGGVWILRNWILAGNPLFPQHFGPFNAPQDIYRERTGSTLLGYVDDPSIWRVYLRPQFDRLFAGPGYVLAVAPLVAMLVVRRRAPAITVVAFAAPLALFAYAATPYSALGPPGMPVAAASSMRYALPALAIGAAVLAAVGTRLPGAFGGALALLAALAAAQGLHTEFDPGVSVLAVAGVAVLVAVLLRAPRRPAVAVIAAGLLVGAAHVRNPPTYAATDPVFAALPTSGAKVGLAGDWSVSGVVPPLPAFGPRIGNTVTYVGPFVRHMLRHERDPAAFAERIKRFDYLIIGRGLAPTGAPAPEEALARQAGFAPVAASQRLALYARR